MIYMCLNMSQVRDTTIVSEMPWNMRVSFVLRLYKSCSCPLPASIALPDLDGLSSPIGLFTFRPNCQRVIARDVMPLTQSQKLGEHRKYAGIY